MTTTVHLEIHFDAGKLDLARDIVRETLVATRAWPGCQGLEVIVDDDDPSRAIVVETWATAADHEAYVAWRATPEGANRLPEVLVEPPVTRSFSTTIPLGA
jgi:quinol monooxygenase YgiN